MSFVPGKLNTTTITGKVHLYEPTADGGRRKAGTLEVTAKKLPKPEYNALRDGFTDEVDLNLCRELVTDIKGAMREDGSPWPLSDGLIDALYTVDWQFNPVVDFVLGINEERIARVLKGKN
jgi:hypothetical protein